MYNNNKRNIEGRGSRFRFVTRSAAITGAFAVTLAACGSGSSSSSSSATTTSSAATTTQLTIQGSTSPITVLNLNPFNGNMGVDLMYNTLMLVNPINGTMSPELATSFKALNSTTLEFTLKSGIKWSNGTPFTAKDVVFTFNMLKKFPALDGGGIWKQVTSVTTSGNTVTFNLNTPDVPLNLSLASVPIVSQAVWSKVANPVTYTAKTPVVTGPYTFDTFAPTKMVLKKNPLSFESGQVKPQTVAFLVGSSSQTTNELLVASGTYDFSYNYFPDVQKTFVARDPAHNKYWFPAGGVISLFMNLTQAPFNNPNFRQGVSWAIDRQAVENKAVFGVENVAPQTGLILPGQSSWANPAIPNNGLVTMNTTKALADFKKAGYVLSNGKLVNSAGVQVSFSIMEPNNYSDWVGAAQQIAANLASVGINATLNEPTSAVYTTNTESGQFQAAIGTFGGSGSAYSAFNPALNSSFAAPVNSSTASNWERFNSPTVDQQLNQLAAATSATSMIKATYPLQSLMYNQVPFIDLYYGGMWGLFSTRHWVGWPSASNPYTLPATWNDDLLAILMHVSPA
ncbi:ABC transporter substrate-binding protein [Acidithrix ferrooxidans]|uniref:Putative D,D-dipeptide-binding periplasmic protein DdpA n=1 Tax=Acidithrix ferrooxidans TaxID=1280514 RepID=A0A0D8HFL1_9ACTN|nr:ABC transporter substrate-binding protein [Acidithrix ferrooxidans]KJF16669.1 putative D,D-dipeptide-binding periplasmic protein DdpA precursor [Acidithrix ferrooxidans]